MGRPADRVGRKAPGRALAAAAIGAACLGLLALAPVGPAAAQSGPPAGASVVFSGKMGPKALLVINGTPRTLAVGAVEQGVHLVALNGDTAVIEVEGQRRNLALGGQVDLSGVPTPGSGTRVVLSMGSGGHFNSAGSINGRAVQFMVDTGASVVALSQGEAERIGLDYKRAPRGIVQTANGQVPVHSVRLSTVRVGEVQVHDVEAVVMPADMPNVLLGNSFLRRFQLQQTNDTMTLVKKP